MKNKLLQYKNNIPVSLLMLLIILIVPVTFTSCEEEENYGTPRITNIRVTDPELGKVPLAEGSLGQMVVIQGENLGSTTHVFFNNLEAFFNPTLVTNTNIIVRIPDDFPTEITDQIKVVTKGGETTYNFPIDIPSPEITRIPLEWVPDGGTLTLIGRFFYNVESINFTGGVSTSSFTVVNPQTIQVIVPPDAESGPVTVQAVAGNSTSRQWFRDNRGMMVNFDDAPICWGGDAFVVDATAIPASVPVSPISGNFYYIKHNYEAGSWWIQETVIAYCGGVSVTGPKANFALAFEMWVGEEWKDNWFEIEMYGDETLIYYEWKGYQQLGGESAILKDTGWMTVKIPLANMTALPGSTFRMGRFGSYKAANADTIEFAFDNFRIVPIN